LREGSLKGGRFLLPPERDQISFFFEKGKKGEIRKERGRASLKSL